MFPRFLAGALLIEIILVHDTTYHKHGLCPCRIGRGMLLHSIFIFLTTEPDYSTWRKAMVKVSMSLAHYSSTL